MKVTDVVNELQTQHIHFSGNGNYVLYVNTTNNSITVWEINNALNDPKRSRFSQVDYKQLKNLANPPGKIRGTDNGVWIGPFNKFEAMGFALHLNNKLFQEEKKTYSIDFSKSALNKPETKEKEMVNTLESVLQEIANKGYSVKVQLLVLDKFDSYGNSYDSDSYDENDFEAMQHDATDTCKEVTLDNIEEVVEDIVRFSSLKSEEVKNILEEDLLQLEGDIAKCSDPSLDPSTSRILRENKNKKYELRIKLTKQLNVQDFIQNFKS
jgi:hypothetical protein